MASIAPNSKPKASDFSSWPVGVPPEITELQAISLLLAVDQVGSVCLPACAAVNVGSRIQGAVLRSRGSRHSVVRRRW